MQTIFLKEEECYCPLDKFYANVAKHLGYDVPYDDEKHTFDCRKICITPSAYQKIKEFYKQIMNPQMERMKFMKKFKYFLLTGMLLATIGLSGCGKKAEDDITNKEIFEDDLQPLTEDELNAMDADTSDDDMKSIDDPDDAEDVENTDN